MYLLTFSDISIFCVRDFFSKSHLGLQTESLKLGFLVSKLSAFLGDQKGGLLRPIIMASLPHDEVLALLAPLCASRSLMDHGAFKPL